MYEFTKTQKSVLRY